MKKMMIRKRESVPPHALLGGSGEGGNTRKSARIHHDASKLPASNIEFVSHFLRGNYSAAIAVAKHLGKAPSSSSATTDEVVPDFHNGIIDGRLGSSSVHGSAGNEDIFSLPSAATITTSSNPASIPTTNNNNHHHHPNTASNPLLNHSSSTSMPILSNGNINGEGVPMVVQKSTRGRKRKHPLPPPPTMQAADATLMQSKPIIPPKPFKLPKPRPPSQSSLNAQPSKKQLREEKMEAMEQAAIQSLIAPVLCIPHVKGTQPNNIHNSNHSRCLMCTLYFRKSAYLSSITADYCVTCYEHLNVKIFVCDDVQCWHDHITHALEVPKGKLLRNYINRSRKTRKVGVGSEEGDDEQLQQEEEEEE